MKMKCKVVQPDLHTGLLYYSVCCWRDGIIPFPVWNPIGTHCRIVHVQRCWEGKLSAPLLCPLLTQLPLFPASKTHVSSREFSFGVSNTRSNASRLFTLCNESGERDNGEPSFTKKDQKKESIVNDEFIFTLCHMAMIDDASHRCYT